MKKLQKLFNEFAKEDIELAEVGMDEYCKHLEQLDILDKFTEKISQQKNLSPKYQKLVSEHFWDLI